MKKPTKKEIAAAREFWQDQLNEWKRWHAQGDFENKKMAKKLLRRTEVVVFALQKLQEE